MILKTFKSGVLSSGLRSMAKNSILIGNVHVMMAYAFRSLKKHQISTYGEIEFEHLHELMAHLIGKEASQQVRRGLHKQYVPHEEELATVRGKIDVTASVKRRSPARGQLVCSFDEFSADTPHNRAVKAALNALVLHGSVSADQKRFLKRLLDHFAHVSDSSLRTIDWSAMTFHRTNMSYRVLLQYCQFLANGFLPSDGEGDILSAWMTDDALNDLFERFVREYFAVHHPHLNSRASNVVWDLDEDALLPPQLPAMRTDITLSDGRRTLIIDTKFYSSALQVGRWGKASLHSSNIYQLFTYVKNADKLQDGSVSGLLLYAKTTADEHPEVDARIQGSRVGATTIDLTEPWPEVRGSLDALLDRW